LAKHVLTFNRGFREAILSGEKQITVRAGEINWADDLRLKVDGQEIAGRKVKQETAALQYLSAEAVGMDGFDDHSEMLEGLRKFYPDLQETDMVTALWFEVVPETPDETKADEAPAEGAEPAEEDEAETDADVAGPRTPALLVSEIANAERRAGGSLSYLGHLLPELDQLAAVDPVTAPDHARLFEAISKAWTLCEDLETRESKLSEAVKKVEEAFASALSLAAAEKRRTEALARPLVCGACGWTGPAMEIVGAQGHPDAAVGGICPNCSMAALAWADASAEEAAAEEVPAEEAPDAEEPFSDGEEPADNMGGDSTPEGDGLVAVRCSRIDPPCSWEGRMAEADIFDGKCPECEGFVAYAEEANPHVFAAETV